MFQGSGGYQISIFLSAHQTVWVCGANSKYQWGITNEELAQTDKSQILKQIKTLVDITQVSGGYEHALCLDMYGHVFSFGSNFDGQLGNERDQKGPKLVENLPKIKAISAGNHSLCVDVDGYMWGFGKNSNFQCVPLDNEIGKQANVTKPTKIDTLPDIETIHCGYSHSICSDKHKNIWAFGSNFNGQLGCPPHNGVGVSLVKIDGIGEPSQISVGYSHTVVLNTNNECFVFGYNTQGQLGIGGTSDVYKPTKLDYNVEFIYCGYFHTFIRTINGECYVSGNNNYGQLGLGHTDFISTFVELPYKYLDVILMGGLHSIFVTEDREYLSCGWNSDSQCCVNGTVSELTEIPFETLACLLPSRTKSARK